MEDFFIPCENESMCISYADEKGKTITYCSKDNTMQVFSVSEARDIVIKRDKLYTEDESGSTDFVALDRNYNTDETRFSHPDIDLTDYPGTFTMYKDYLITDCPESPDGVPTRWPQVYDIVKAKLLIDLSKIVDLSDSYIAIFAFGENWLIANAENIYLFKKMG